MKKNEKRGNRSMLNIYALSDASEAHPVSVIGNQQTGQRANGRTGKLITSAVICVLVSALICVFTFPLYAGLGFTVTAEPAGAWDMDTVVPDQVITKDKWTVTTDTGGGTEDILVKVSDTHAYPWTAGGASSSDNTFGLKTNVAPIVNIIDTDNPWLDDALDDSYSFGLYFQAPTSQTSNMSGEHTLTITLTAQNYKYCAYGTCCEPGLDCDGDGQTHDEGDCDEGCNTCYVGSSHTTLTPDEKDQDCNGVLNNTTIVYADHYFVYQRLRGSGDDCNTGVDNAACDTCCKNAGYTGGYAHSCLADTPSGGNYKDDAYGCRWHDLGYPPAPSYHVFKCKREDHLVYH